MPSVKNPNGPSKNRLAARDAAAKKTRRKASQFAQNKIARKDVALGARPGILPTSGPRAKISAKKARKLEKKLGYALKRKELEAEGQGEGDDKEMQDVPNEDPLIAESEMEIQ